MSAPNSAAEPFYPGLAGVVAGETAVSAVTQDSLHYRGYAIDDLAEHASFEEVAYLLLHGEAPTTAQLENFRNHFDAHRAVPKNVLDALERIPADVSLMDVLRTTVSLAGHVDPASDGEPETAAAERLLALIPSIIAARLRLLSGHAPLEPQPGLSHAAQLLQLLSGEAPRKEAERTLDLTFTLYAEHDFNASAYAARVCTSTGSDLFSSIVAAIGTLKGSLHGGANEQATKLLTRFSSADEARTWAEQALERKERIMGFGHRVYKNGDHRARILETVMRDLAAQHAEGWRVEIYDAIRDVVTGQKGLHPNLDYPCGMAYHLLGLPIDCYTPLFVAARTAGWAAHVFEQRREGRLIRPRSKYVGPKPRAWPQSPNAAS